MQRFFIVGVVGLIAFILMMIAFGAFVRIFG